VPSANISYVTSGGLSSALDDPSFFGIAQGGSGKRFLVVGEGQGKETISISAVDTGAKTFTIEGRGRSGTQAKNHAVGSKIEVHISRPDGLFSDQIVNDDVLDLRHSVSLGEWDYNRILESSVRDLLVGDMRTTYKQAGSGSNSIGKRVEEVSALVSLGGEARNYANIVDAPDGIRTTWSDAPVRQNDVTFLIDPTTAINSNGLTPTSIDASLLSTWTIGAKFNPTAFFYGTNPIQNGSFIKFNIGGLDNASGARAGLKPDLDTKVVRFISPQESEGQFDPFKIKFSNYNRPNGFGESGTQGEYVSPTEVSHFEEPYIVLGEDFFTASGLVAETTTGNIRNLAWERRSGVYTKVWAIKVASDLDAIYTANILYDTTNLSNLITDNQKDPSGLSSKAYLVLYGDKDQQITNNGVFKIIGAGSNSSLLEGDLLTYNDAPTYTAWNGEGTAQNWVYLLRVGSNDNLFVNEPTHALFAEMRTQYLDSRDDECMIAFTSVSDSDRATHTNLPPVAERSAPIVISTTLQYPPARGASARVLDDIHTIALRNITTGYLRNSPSRLDVDAVNEMPLPNGEVYLPVSNHVESWSKLDLSDQEEISNSEIKKEAEAFIDVGSKTIVLRPYSDQGIRLSGHTLSTSVLGSENYGDANNTPKFGSPNLFNDARTEVYAVPQEIMPTFGRQDIPYHVKTSDVDPYMEGYNHLFSDQRITTSNSFRVIGGQYNGSGVYPLIFATGVAGSTYGQWVANSNLANQGAFVAKKISLSGKPSSEFGDVLNGIKLPPFFGIVRLYGVYEAQDFNGKAPNAGIGSHETDRETPTSNAGIPPTNLLRKDNDLFPLYILRRGGAEITVAGEEESHTYVVTEHALDISKVPTYVDGNSFSDFDYVVECTVFGFGVGFINENNFVLARKYDASDSLVGVAGGAALTNIRMCLPSPVSHTDEVYVAGTRTVYQGDPFQTIGGASPSYTDQAYRYGLIPPSNTYLLNTPRGQEETDGTSAIEVANKRSLEVLASIDFYTTMGTGAVGGLVRRNTLKDVGYSNYISNFALIASGERVALSPTQDLPQTKIGLFTEVLGMGSERASATITVFSPFFDFYSNNNGSDSYLRIEVDDSSGKGIFTYQVDINSAPANYNDLVQEIVTFFNGTPVDFVTEERTTSVSFTFFSPTLGEEGNKTTLNVSLQSASTGGVRSDTGIKTKLFSGGRVGSNYDNPTLSKVNMTGGRTKPVNAISFLSDFGARDIDISLVGLTSRLPLGILVSDHDFMCEDVLRDGSTRLQTFGSKLTSLPSSAGSDEQGRPYTKITGGAGEILHMGDGDVLSYGAFPLAGGTKKYRVFRGGGSVYGGSGDVKGAPLTFLNDSFSEELNPVLKGSVLACRAMLVRNFEETAFNAQNLSVRSHGDEIQLLIATQAVFKGKNERLSSLPLKIGGEMSPSGFGEGFACADRFRVKGLPLMKGNSQVPEDNEPAKLSLDKSIFNIVN
tara:strand:+ start:92 stop:4513 length:4422 start_codon:yes stop_codon:yes gene_type:complete